MLGKFNSLNRAFTGCSCATGSLVRLAFALWTSMERRNFQSLLIMAVEARRRNNCTLGAMGPGMDHRHEERRHHCGSGRRV